MKKIILSFASFLLFPAAFAQDSVCETLWNTHKKSPIKIQKLKNATCAYIWEESKLAPLLQKMNLKQRNTQWMSIGECERIQVGAKAYTLYDAYYKRDLSDLKIIRDQNNNAYGFFRDLGQYDVFDDKFTPTTKANKNGVELKCASLGDNQELPKILIQYIQQKGVNLTKYSNDDRGK